MHATHIAGHEYPGDRRVPPGDNRKRPPQGALAGEGSAKAQRALRPQQSSFVANEMKFPAQFRLHNICNKLAGRQMYATLEDVGRVVGNRRKDEPTKCLVDGRAGHFVGQRKCPARLAASAGVQAFCEEAWTARNRIRAEQREARKEAKAGSVAAAQPQPEQAEAGAVDVAMQDA